MSRTLEAPYRLGFATARALAKAKPLPAPSVAVGNLTFGGTGKTPLVALLAGRYAKRTAVCVLSRGYGGRGGAAREASPDSDPRDVGDEPCWLARELAGRCRVFVGADRHEAAALALAGGHVGLFVLDDALQRHDLAPDVRVCLLTQAEALSPARLPPLGPWREDKSALAHMDAVVVNRKFSPPERHPIARAFSARYEVTEVSGHAGNVEGARFLLVSGVSDNDSVLAAAHSVGVEPVAHARFRDHARFGERTARRIEARARALNALVLATSKDAVKLSRSIAGVRELKIAMVVEREDEFFALVDRALPPLTGD